MVEEVYVALGHPSEKNDTITYSLQSATCRERWVVNMSMNMSGGGENAVKEK